MPRKHQRIPGSRRYKDYTEEMLEECVRRIKSGNLTQRDAEKEYSIPRSTIKNKLSGKHLKPVGQPLVLSFDEERLILNRVQLMCDYGFPATPQDVRHYIKCYLYTKNRTVEQFKDNLPGTEYMFYLLKRHKDYTNRLTSNIKCARAAVDEKVLGEYVEPLEKELEGIPPSNIWNFDETCLVNDPGRLKCIMKRGTCYPERVMNHTKAGVSIMFCGNAEGELLLPYCVYKSTSVIMDSWVRGAPPGTKFNRTKSGWFDERTFEFFFNNILLPRIKKQESAHAMIGDNLSSHISESVVRKCERHNVKFICLPPNSTHLTQPLDVAYFKPLETSWRSILNDFRKTKVGQKGSAIPKDIFPRLLSQLVKALEEGNGKANLIKGFKKCGIVPIDVTPMLARILGPENSTKQDNAVAADQSLINILTELRGEGLKRTKKSKRIAVVPGKSVSVEDIENQDPTENQTSSGSSKQPSKKKPSSSKTSRKRKVQFPDSERDDESDDNGWASEELLLEEVGHVFYSFSIVIGKNAQDIQITYKHF